MSVDDKKDLVTSDTKVDFMKYILSQIQDQIRFADSKANFFFSFAIILIGVALSTLLKYNDVYDYLTKHNYQWVFFILILMFIVYLVFVLLGLVKIVIVYYPRISPTNTKSICYFDYISTLTNEEYSNKIDALKYDEMVSSLTSQIVKNSRIVSLKYRHLKTSIYLLIISLIVGISYVSLFTIILGMLSG